LTLKINFLKVKMASIKINNVKEMMVQRGFETIKEYQDYFLGENTTKEYLYIKIFNGKLELNTVRKFLCANFTFEAVSYTHLRAHET
jgi:hypothetical protein